MEFAEIKKVEKRHASTVFKGKLDFEVEIPAGCTPVAFRIPRPGERYLIGNRIQQCTTNTMKRSYLIIRVSW